MKTITLYYNDPENFYDADNFIFGGRLKADNEEYYNKNAPYTLGHIFAYNQLKNIDRFTFNHHGFALETVGDEEFKYKKRK